MKTNQNLHIHIIENSMKISLGINSSNFLLLMIVIYTWSKDPEVSSSQTTLNTVGSYFFHTCIYLHLILVTMIICFYYLKKFIESQLDF